ncbi:MAG: class A sortase [Bacteroides sp.]|nr:class A sortase [Bacteroides sp.]
MNKTLKRLSWLLAGIIVLGVGLALIFNGQIKNELVRENQTTGLHKITKNSVKKNNEKKGEYDFSKVKELGWQEVAQSRSKKDYGYGIGALAIPSVGMYLPIEKGLSNTNMSIGGCTMRADQVMGKGNYPLAGHYMTNNGILFSPLERTQIGQKVYLTDMSKVYEYQITTKKVVDPTAVWLVDNTPNNVVTLITCADGGAKRWAIRGNLIGESPANKQNLQIFGL